MIQLNLFGNDKYDAIDNAVDESFWIYHAGMADGDGCIQRKNGAANRVVYRLSLMDKNIIEELANLYEVKITKRKKYKEHHSQMYTVALHSNNSRHFYSKIAPYMIEKRKILYEICKDQNIEINQPYRSINDNVRLMWMAGYFDAEGSVKMSAHLDPQGKNHNFKFKVKFTSTDFKTIRFVKKLCNRTFGMGSIDPPFKLYKKKKKMGEKQAYDVLLRRANKVYIFGKVMLPCIKIQRKIDKFKRIFDYAKFAADMKWKFGKFNFKTNEKMRKNYIRNEME